MTGRYARLIARSPHPTVKFLVRLPSVAAIAALVVAEASGDRALAQPLMLLAVVLAPTLLPRTVLYPRAGSPPPGNPDGGGQGPDPIRPTPRGPAGGVPLPDAEPARVRVRDHERPALKQRQLRRGSREPEPARRPVQVRRGADG